MPPPRPVIAAAVIATLGIGAWLMYHTFTNPATRDCERRYAGARTAQDTSVIDTMVVASARQLAEPRSCGSFRGNWH